MSSKTMVRPVSPASKLVGITSILKNNSSFPTCDRTSVMTCSLSVDSMIPNTSGSETMGSFSARRFFPINSSFVKPVRPMYLSLAWTMFMFRSRIRIMFCVKQRNAESGTR